MQATVCSCLIAFVRTHPNLGCPVVQSYKFSRYQGGLPISRRCRFYQRNLGRETGVLSTRVTNTDP